MIRILLIILLLSTSAHAQYMRGNVRDKESGKPLANVLVVNSNTQRYVYTDDSGYFSLQVAPRDTAVFLLSFYHTLKLPALRLPGDVVMSRINYSLEEVEVLPELERLQREELEMRKTYDKAISDAKRKPKVIPQAGTNPGVTAEGLISNMASTISGQRKRDKRFLRTFETMQEQKFIATRYNPDVVMAAVKTTPDSAIAFINANPMERDYAMQSSALELQMWIRYHFKLWAQKQNQPGMPAKRPD